MAVTKELLHQLQKQVKVHDLQLLNSNNPFNQIFIQSLQNQRTSQVNPLEEIQRTNHNQKQSRLIILRLAKSLVKQRNDQIQPQSISNRKVFILILRLQNWLRFKRWSDSILLKNNSKTKRVHSQSLRTWHL